MLPPVHIQELFYLVYYIHWKSNIMDILILCADNIGHDL